MQANTAPIEPSSPSYDLALAGDEAGRLPLRTAIIVIGSLSALLWAGIVGLVSVLS